MPLFMIFPLDGHAICPRDDMVLLQTEVERRAPRSYRTGGFEHRHMPRHANLLTDAATATS